jgi:hypothetical protein
MIAEGFEWMSENEECYTPVDWSIVPSDRLGSKAVLLKVFHDLR